MSPANEDLRCFCGIQDDRTRPYPADDVFCRHCDGLSLSEKLAKVQRKFVAEEIGSLSSLEKERQELLERFSRYETRVYHHLANMKRWKAVGPTDERFWPDCSSPNGCSGLHGREEGTSSNGLCEGTSVTANSGMPLDHS